jgi:hypothetical protein
VYVVERFVIGQAETSGPSRKHWFQSGCSRKLVGELTLCRDKGEKGDKNYAKTKPKRNIRKNRKKRR